MRIPEYYKQVEPSLAKIPASDAGAGIIRLPGGQSKAGEAISGSLANVSAAVAQRQAPMSGAEKLLDHAMRASALLGQFAEKQQKEIDDMDLYGFKAASDAELFNILNDIQTSGDYRDCRERGKDAWNKYGEEALKNLDNKRIAKRAEDYLKIKTIGVQADFQGVFIKRQQDYRNAKLLENEDQAIENRQYIKLKQLIDSATNLSEEQKVVRWKNGQRRISLLNAEGDLKRLEADFEYSEEKYPGLAPEDVQAFNDKRDVFVENRFVKERADEYIKKYGMKHESVYRLIHADENLKDEQINKIWSIYRAWYSDQERFRSKAENAHEDNFFKALQGFDNQQDAIAYALKNSKSLHGFNTAKSFINWVFEGRRETAPDKFNEVMNGINEGKYNNYTLARFKGEVAQFFTRDDFNEYILPTFRKLNEDIKNDRRVTDSVVRDDINKIKKDVLNNDNALIEKVDKLYMRMKKDKPDMNADECIELYKKLSAKNNLGTFWDRRYYRGYEIYEMEKKGLVWDPEKRYWTDGKGLKVGELKK